jgi:glyoxylase-like metal-dependent hydrolase (beta-lactamase superfamily II)
MKITGNIHALKLPFAIPLGSGMELKRFVYCYLICAEEVILIDCGVAGAEKAIAEYLKSIGRDISEIGLALFTHAHPDHIGAASEIGRASGCRFAAHRDAVGWIENPDEQFRARPVPGFKTLVGGGVGIDEIIGEGAVSGGGGLRAVHTPGHAAGHLAFYDEREGVLLSGDALPQAGELPVYEDVAAVLASLDKLAELEPAWLLSSWNDPEEFDPAGRIASARGYVLRIDEIVREESWDHPGMELTDLTGEVLARLGLPPILANPITARTVAAHLEYGGRGS